MGTPPDPFDRWLGAIGPDDAVDERRRTGWLRRQAADDASWLQLLDELRGRGVPVVVHTAAGSALRGTLETVGTDFCALKAPSGQRVLVLHSGVVALRPGAEVLGAPPQQGAPARPRLSEALGALVHDDARVLVRCAAPAAELRGDIAGLGPDHVELRLDNGETAYVPLWSVAEVAASG